MFLGEHGVKTSSGDQGVGVGGWGWRPLQVAEDLVLLAPVHGRGLPGRSLLVGSLLGLGHRHAQAQPGGLRGQHRAPLILDHTRTHTQHNTSGVSSSMSKRNTRGTSAFRTLWLLLLKVQCAIFGDLEAGYLVRLLLCWFIFGPEQSHSI